MSTNNQITPLWRTMLLDEVVAFVSHDFEWSPKDSIFKLIIMLCLPEMQERWETLRASLLCTKVECIQELTVHSAEEGKLIELVALLSVDSTDFHTESKNYYGQNDKFTAIEISRQRVATKMVSLIVEERKLTGSRSNKLVQKRRLMMSVMLLLEIFERIGEEIEYLVSGSHLILTESSKRSEIMAKFLVFKLRDSGFPVTNEFDFFKQMMNCKSFLDERQGNLSGGGCGSTFEQKDTNIAVYTNIQSPPISKKQTNGMPLGQQRRPISTHSLQEKPGLLSMAQSNYMSQKFTTKFSPKFCTATEAQIRRPVPGLALCKKLSSFLSVIKGGI
ncbi:uncharacterized protein LOC132276687 [Cornus florida]|uniref:uncharacterized protein LOC132276687 n=1 Tax=Cornus florida TaxID=4283 RepID=UPI00289E2289|nr:uncharacterized protein LOC132276687 [Cornus florida]